MQRTKNIRETEKMNYTKKITIQPPKTKPTPAQPKQNNGFHPKSTSTKQPDTAKRDQIANLPASKQTTSF
ncbi:hypothetical protein MA16_Dca027311 [Dendrobium catenatum]|uniref:Uncharacterized protein n=1 Tax=Dendrobium catenatum TaxID=906689 RepID=A0A2I0V804_9ASPA|nr:hypothetical protein MA16_Dca027311 [Dendrobium catenatum]